MNEQRIWWKRPRVVTFAVVLILMNLVVDWWVFKPQNLAIFLAVEAVIIGGIVCVAVAFSNRPA